MSAVAGVWWWEKVWWWERYGGGRALTEGGLMVDVVDSLDIMSE